MIELYYSYLHMPLFSYDDGSLLGGQDQHVIPHSVTAKNLPGGGARGRQKEYCVLFFI